MARRFLNRVQMTVTGTPGTGAATLNAATAGYQTVASAGGNDGDGFSYLFTDASNAWEIGEGVYTASGTSLARTFKESSTGSILSLTSAAIFSIIELANDIASGFFEPQGRLTLTSGTPVLTASVTAATTVYYALYKGAYVPIWDGTKTIKTLIAELSQATTDSTKSPAAAGTYSNYDIFVWNDSGTMRCTRGPAWTQAQTFTITIASPGVATCTGHGFHEGMPVVLSTTGALPTGLSAGTTYFVCDANNGLAANAFELAATVGGAAINTSGSQSGTHTVTQNVTVRGTGAGTSQISRNADGYYTNTVAITNGPGAGLGTYVGTIVTNGSSQVDYILGGAGAGGGESTNLGVWNCYNRVSTILINYDNTASYAYSTNTARIKNGNYANRTSFVCGLSEDAVSAISSIRYVSTNSSGSNDFSVNIGLNQTTATQGVAGGNSIFGFNNQASALANDNLQLISFFNGFMPLGYSYLAQVEKTDETTTTWYPVDHPFHVTVRA